MDLRDFRILAQLFQDPFASDARLARGVGLTRPAVRTRLDRLEAGGILGGFVCLPAAEIFGRRSVLLPFRSARLHLEDLSAVLAIEPVVWASLKHDGSVTVGAYVRNRARSVPARLVEQMGGAPSGVYASSLPMPRPGRPDVSAIDLRVLLAMIPNPVGTVAEFAADTGLTEKTVRRRRDGLVQQGLVAVVPVVESPSAKGVLLFNLAVYGATRRDRAQVLAAVPRALVLNESEQPPMLYLLCQADSLGEVVDVERRVRGIPGVQEVHLTLHRRWGIRRERLVAWTREELARRKEKG